MKKLISLCLVLAVLALPVAAFAEIDLSGMSFAELIDLRQQIDLLLFGSDEYKSVSVPQGIYTVGEDIPAGTYSLSVSAEAYSAYIEVYSAMPLDYENRVCDYRISPSEPVAKITFEDGQIIQVESSNITFETYTGLGF